MTRHRRLPAAAWAVLAVALAPPSGAAADPASTDFFTLAAAAPVVAAVAIDERREDAATGFVRYAATPLRVLSGAAPSAPLLLVQELIFPSERPLLAIGDEWLLALEPLPSSSRYESLRRDGIRFRVRGGTAGARRPQAIGLVAPFLAAASEPPPARRRARIAAVLAALSCAEVGDDAVRFLAAEADLARSLTGEHVAVMAAALTNRDIDVARRRALLDVIAAQRLTAMIAAVQHTGDDADLVPFARRTLAALGVAPALAELRADLQQGDAAARMAALAAAQALPASERLPLLAAVAATDAEYEVRSAAIDGLAAGGADAAPALAALLDDGDGRIAYRAARGLVTAGGADAVAVLAATFASDNFDAQVAAVFALRDIASEDAMRVLRETRDAPPDPRLEKVLAVALGDSGHHH